MAVNVKKSVLEFNSGAESDKNSDGQQSDGNGKTGPNPSDNSSPQGSPKQSEKSLNLKAGNASVSANSSQTSGSRELPLWEREHESETSSTCWQDKEDELAKFSLYVQDSISRSSESSKSLDISLPPLLRTPDCASVKDFLKDKKGSDKKRKTSSWYNMLNPTYKSRSEDFKRLFKDLPETERLIVDYSCALQKDILVHGRLYISQNFLCFYANIFRWETCLMIRCKDVTAITKEKTALVIPNAIQICSSTEKHFFTSFGARDKTYLMLFRIWQNALLDQPMTPQEAWQWVHHSYGEDLGLTSDDDDYVAPHDDFESSMCNGKDLKRSPVLLGPDLAKGNLTIAGAALKLHCGKMAFYENGAAPLFYELIGEGSDGHPLSPGGNVAELLAHGHWNAAGLTEELFRGVCGDEDIEDIVVSSQLGSTPVDPDLSPLPLTPNTPGSDMLISPLVLLQRQKSRRLETINRRNKSKSAPADVSDSSDSENDAEGGIKCPCEIHEGKEIVNSVFPLSVDQYFNMAFADSPFYRKFQESRKTTDLNCTNWEEECGTKKRKLACTLALTLSIGPKTAQNNESHTLLHEKPGHLYVVQVDAITTGIPYSDDFFTRHMHCITRVSVNECRVTVHSIIKYKKSVWGFIKSLIEKNAMQGIEEYYRDWEGAVLREFSGNQPVKGRNPPRWMKAKKMDAKYEQVSSDTKPKSQKFWRIAQGSGQGESNRSTVDFLIRIMLVTLILLLFLNALLYYKLWSLEEKHQKPVFYPSYVDPEILRKPKSHEDWLRLLQHQETLHHTEVSKWKDMLEAAVGLLKQTENALLSLQNSIQPMKSVQRRDHQHLHQEH